MKKKFQLFPICNYGLFVLLSAICIIPFIHILAVSLAPISQVQTQSFILWPQSISFETYTLIFKSGVIPQSLKISVLITVLGTLISMALSLSLGYGLSIKELPAHRLLNFLLFFTMIFGGGLVPLYQIVRGLKMTNTVWAMMIPNAMNAFWVILIRNFISGIPKSLRESAYMDGAPEMTIFTKIILPLSKAVIAAVTLFYAVQIWNSYFQALMFVTDPKLWPIQVWLRSLIAEGGQMDGGAVTGAMDELTGITTKTMQMAVVILATAPIVVLYPFLQKHFAKGVTLGAVKG